MRLDYMNRFTQGLVGMVLGLLLIIGCGKNDDLTGVQMPYRYQFDVPAGLNPQNTHFFKRDDLQTNASVILGANDVSRIIPFQARLTSLDNIDFSFIREVEIRVVDPDNPGLEIPVFYREELPQNIGRSIDLISIQTDVTNILNKPAIDVIVIFELYGTSAQTFQSDLQISFLAQ